MVKKTDMTKKQLLEEAKNLIVDYPTISMDDQAWPLRDVLNKLIEATEILLDKKDYDGHGWEEIRYALIRGKEISEQLKKHTLICVQDELTKEDFNDMANGRDNLKVQPLQVNEDELIEIARAYASTLGYPQSDKELFETTFWTQHNIAAEGFIKGFKYLINTYK